MDDFDVGALDDILGDDTNAIQVTTSYKPRERRRRTRGESMQSEVPPAAAPAPVPSNSGKMGVDSLDDALFGLGGPSKPKSTTPKPTSDKKTESSDGEIKKSDLYEELMRKKDAIAAKKAADAAAAEKAAAEAENPTQTDAVTSDTPTSTIASATGDSPFSPVNTVVTPVSVSSNYVPRTRNRGAVAGRRSRGHSETSTPVPTNSSGLNVGVDDHLQHSIKEPEKLTPHAPSRTLGHTSDTVHYDDQKKQHTPESSYNQQLHNQYNQRGNNGGYDSNQPYNNGPSSSSFGANPQPHQPTGAPDSHRQTLASPRHFGIKTTPSSSQRGSSGYGQPSYGEQHQQQRGYDNDAQVRELQAKLAARDATIEELQRAKRQLTADVHAAKVNADQIVEESRVRYGAQNDEELRRTNDLLNSKRAELEKEREAHIETKRAYDAKMRMLATELTTVNNQATLDAEERAREQLEHAYKLQEETLLQQRLHFERELENEKQRHSRDMEALRRQTVDAIFLKNLASKVETSASSLENLHEKVRSDRSLTEKATLDQLRIREKLLREKEEKLNATREQQAEMLLSLQKLQSEHENERVRLKNEHLRLKTLAEESSAHSSVLREQLRADRDLAVQEATQLKQDRASFELERKRVMGDLQAQKELTVRTRNQLNSHMEDAKREQQDVVHSLDTERRELSKLKKDLTIKKTLLDDRIEQLRQQEIKFKKHVHYVEKNMHDLDTFGSKVKQKAASLARSYKAARVDIAKNEKLKAQLEAEQAELKSAQTQLASEQRLLEQERNIFEKRRLGWMKDQKISRSSALGGSSAVKSEIVNPNDPHHYFPATAPTSSDHSASLQAQKARLSQSLSRNQNDAHKNKLVPPTVKVEGKMAWQTSSTDSGLQKLATQEKKYGDASSNEKEIGALYGETAAFPLMSPVSLDQLALQQQLDHMAAEANEMKEYLQGEEAEQPIMMSGDDLSISSTDLKTGGGASLSLSKFSSVPSSVVMTPSEDLTSNAYTDTTL